MATETCNEKDVRYYAVRQLRRLGVEMGVRQPVMLADRILQRMEDDERTSATSAMDCETFPLSAPY